MFFNHFLRICTSLSLSVDCFRNEFKLGAQLRDNRIWFIASFAKENFNESAPSTNPIYIVCSMNSCIYVDQFFLPVLISLFLLVSTKRFFPDSFWSVVGCSCFLLLDHRAFELSGPSMWDRVDRVLSDISSILGNSPLLCCYHYHSYHYSEKMLPWSSEWCFFRFFLCVGTDRNATLSLRRLGFESWFHRLWFSLPRYSIRRLWNWRPSLHIMSAASQYCWLCSTPATRVFSRWFEVLISM